jgi:hypothetical protein
MVDMPARERERAEQPLGAHTHTTSQRSPQIFPSPIDKKRARERERLDVAAPEWKTPLARSLSATHINILCNHRFNINLGANHRGKHRARGEATRGDRAALRQHKNTRITHHITQLLLEFGFAPKLARAYRANWEIPNSLLTRKIKNRG